MEYHKNFGHTLGLIHTIALISTLLIFYTACPLVTQTVAPTLTSFQGIKQFIQYIVGHPHNPIIFCPSTSYYGSNVIRLTCRGDQVEEYTTQNCIECHHDADHGRIINRRRSVSGIIHSFIGITFCLFNQL